MELLDRIFYGAIEVFKEKGIKFTMDSIAQRVGISKRTLYETIPSKNELIEYVIDRTFADVKQQQKLIFEDTSMPLVEKLQKYFTIVPSYSNIVDYRRVNEIKHSYPKIYKEISDHINNDWDRTIELLEEGTRGGIIKPVNLVILKVLFCEIFEKLLDGQFLIQNNITYETAMKETISIIFDGILKEDAKKI